MKRSECTMGRKVKRQALACTAGMDPSKVTRDRVNGEICGTPYRANGNGGYLVLVRWADSSESPVSISRLEVA